jgi:hypothetical protein
MVSATFDSVVPCIRAVLSLEFNGSTALMTGLGNCRRTGEHNATAVSGDIVRWLHCSAGRQRTGSTAGPTPLSAHYGEHSALVVLVR